MRIRPATAADEAAWRAMWDDFVQSGPEPCAPEAASSVWRGVTDPASPLDCLIAEEQSSAIGFLLYVTHPYSWSARPVCYMLDLYVRPEHRGRGLGRQLIDTLAETGRQAGWLKIYWMTQSDNPARALYDRVAKRSKLVRYDLYLSPH
jgi:ribosomal protein S18 acetylase RimI-like enzyme